ncbi:MAG TPA: lipid-A-disaccharide synthase N-terminal domain-containing protein [Thermoanaerobaculia bacterium]|nr:lipid-A-disaccharide synthase N-terminal domain-containing protein [Thermoanaerobaculia bacterium]
MEHNPVWLAIGFFGQALFFGRFFIQWLASERRKESVIPRAFWYFSMGGGLVLLAYAIHRNDPVFILGQSTGIFIYTRNLWFIHRRPAAAAAIPAPPVPPADIDQP